MQSQKKMEKQNQSGLKTSLLLKAVMKFSTNNAAEEDWKERPDNLNNICFTTASAESVIMTLSETLGHMTA